MGSNLGSAVCQLCEFGGATDVENGFHISRGGIGTVLKFVKGRSSYSLRSWKLSSTNPLCGAHNLRSRRGPYARVAVRNISLGEPPTGRGGKRGPALTVVSAFKGREPGCEVSAAPRVNFHQGLQVGRVMTVSSRTGFEDRKSHSEQTV